MCRLSPGPGQILFATFIVGQLVRGDFRSRRSKVDGVDLELRDFFLALGNRARHECEPATVPRDGHLLDTPGRGSDAFRALRGVGVFLRVRGLASAGRGAPLQRFGKIEFENHVAALGGTISKGVFPGLFVGVLLILAPGSTGGEVDGFGIGRPAEGVHRFVAEGDRESFAPVRRNQVELGDRFVFGVLASVAATRLFAGRRFPLREERDPEAVGRPAGYGFVARLRQLGKGTSRRAALAVEPQIGLEDLTIPVSPIGSDHHRVAVRRNLDRGKLDIVEKLVERDFWLFRGGESRTRDRHAEGSEADP